MDIAVACYSYSDISVPSSKRDDEFKKRLPRFIVGIGFGDYSPKTALAAEYRT